MIIGIGNDLIEIDRIKKACEKEAFLLRIFSAKEIELFKEKPIKLAGNFAVKEAVSKCFGTGFAEGIVAKDIEVLRDLSGKPYVNLYGSAKQRFIENNGIAIHVSISNTKEYAMAFAVMEAK